MSSRTVAIIEWAIAAAIIVWLVAFFVQTQLYIGFSLGVVVSSVFFGTGMIVSLGINGAVHFFRRPLHLSELILLGIEALIVLLLVVAGIVDQYEYANEPSSSLGSSFGHWLDWFMPLWVLLGPVALTVLILGLVNRSRARSAPPVPSR